MTMTLSTISAHRFAQNQALFNLPNLFKPISQTIESYSARSKRRAVVKSALIAITQRYPDWVDTGFDEHFMAHEGASIMADYCQTGQLPDAAALVDAWSNQFFWCSETKQSTQARFLPVAQDFVYILRSA
ncbi:MAG: hypothetical protein AAF702_16980 [Chloroflexota bacterium]